MKKIYALAAFAVASFSANAQSIPFDYSGLLENNGWVSHSGNPGQVSTDSLSLIYSGINSTGNKAVLDKNTQSQDLNFATTDTITSAAYMSAIINYNDATGLGTDYFTGFGATKGTNLTVMAARVHAKLGTAPNTFNLGILNSGGAGGAATFDTTDLPFGTPVYIVVKHDLSTNTSTLWVNPTVGDSNEPTPSVTNNSSTNTTPRIVSIFLRNGNNTGKVEIDEIIVSDNWADVNYVSASTKENNIDGLNIFPNPANDVLNITSNSLADKNVQLFDLTGKKVLDVTTTSQVNVSTLKAGVYVAKINEAGKTATRKVVIK